VTSSFAVFEDAIRVKPTHPIKSFLKARKKRKFVIKRTFYINLHPKNRLDTEFTTC